MFRIRPMENRDLIAIRQFTDREIGGVYYSAVELEGIFNRSLKDGVMCSLVLVNGHNEIMGIRFTYPPGQWEHGKGKGLEPQKWPHRMEDTAYFQSIFLSNKVQGD